MSGLIEYITKKEEERIRYKEQGKSEEQKKLQYEILCDERDKHEKSREKCLLLIKNYEFGGKYACFDEKGEDLFYRSTWLGAYNKLIRNIKQHEKQITIIYKKIEELIKDLK
jgi:hypothetical protein